MTVDEIVAAALQLDRDDLARVKERIDQVLGYEPAELSEAEWDEAWGDEVERRHQELQEGKVKTVPGDEVMASVRAIVRS